MLIDDAKPPLTGEALAMAMVVAEDPMRWTALLKRPFWTLKPDGPFVYDKAMVTATGRDRLASLGDPPSQFRLELVRFRLEAIDTGWKVDLGPPRPARRRQAQAADGAVALDIVVRRRQALARRGAVARRHSARRRAQARPTRELMAFPLTGSYRGGVGAISSAVRAPALHAGCRGFESLIAHY